MHWIGKPRAPPLAASSGLSADRRFSIRCSFMPTLRQYKFFGYGSRYKCAPDNLSYQEHTSEEYAREPRAVAKPLPQRRNGRVYLLGNRFPPPAGNQLPANLHFCNELCPYFTAITCSGTGEATSILPHTYAEKLSLTRVRYETLKYVATNIV